ncbi:MAG: hypothetical protein RLZZ292_711 [Bacteroidota bacterium]|jgi:RNA polymerase sigma-70 factor (ECF subfamily)
MNESEIPFWIELCRAGNTTAQQRVFQHYYSYAYNTCRRYAKNKEETEEMVGDAFYKIFSKIDQFIPNTTFKAWIYRILVNTAIEYFRKYHQNKDYSTQELDSVSNLAAADDATMANLDFEDMTKIVQQLPPAYRTVFNLFVVEQFTHEEIAQQLHISSSTSKSNLTRARQKLKEMYLKNN